MYTNDAARTEWPSGPFAEVNPIAMPGDSPLDQPRKLRLRVNGRIFDLNVGAGTPLLYILRNDLALNGPKYGCGLGECGTCTVLIDGVAARACVIPVGGVEGRTIVTLEGLATDGRLHPVQSAFVAEQAAQCGYCLNGMIMTAAALLARVPHPSEAAIHDELKYNLCRCGTHVEIVKAVLRASLDHRQSAGD